MTKHLLHFFILLFCAATLLAEDKAADLPYDVAPWPIGDSLRAPLYPDLALRAAVPSKVQVQLLVEASGMVHAAAIISAVPRLGFEDEIEKVVPAWHFTPATKNGRPVPALIELEFEFVISACEADKDVYRNTNKHRSSNPLLVFQPPKMVSIPRPIPNIPKDFPTQK